MFLSFFKLKEREKKITYSFFFLFPLPTGRKVICVVKARPPSHPQARFLLLENDWPGVQKTLTNTQQAFFFLRSWSARVLQCAQDDPPPREFYSKRKKSLQVPSHLNVMQPFLR
jgi:hypothetical protein